MAYLIPLSIERLSGICDLCGVCLGSFLEKVCFGKGVGGGLREGTGFSGLAAWRGCCPSSEVEWQGSEQEQAEWWSTVRRFARKNENQSVTEDRASGRVWGLILKEISSRSLVFMGKDYWDHLDFSEREQGPTTSWYSVSLLQYLAQPNWCWCAGKKQWLFPSTLNFSKIYGMWSFPVMWSFL